MLSFSINLLLLAPISTPERWIDLSHTSTPALSSTTLRVANRPRDREIDLEILDHVFLNVFSRNPIFVDQAIASMDIRALDSDVFLAPTNIPFQLDSSLINTSSGLSTNRGTFTIYDDLTSNSSPAATAENQNWEVWFPIILKALNTRYYVATDGNDSAPGTKSQPWRTIQKASDSMMAGDIVIVMTGEYDERVQITTSGASGAPITYQTEGTVTTNGFSVWADHITIDGFEITDTDNHWSDGWGIFVEGNHCVLENNYIHFATRGGIMLYANGGDDPVTNNCVVKNNRLRRNTTAGIEVQGRSNIIEGNEIWDTIQYHPKWINPPGSLDADGIRFFGSGHTIRKNYIHDIRLDDPQNVDPHIDCFQTFGDNSGQDIIFEQNYCENLNEGMYAFMLEESNDLTIRNNIFVAAGGVNTGGGGNSNLTIVNNVFASDSSFQLYSVGVSLIDCPNTVLQNNIFYDLPYHTIRAAGNRSGQEIDYNLAYRSDGQASQCYTIDNECADPVPAHDLWDIDPLFINPAYGDFHLQGGSPARNAGISLAEVANDFDGTNRPQGSGYDIGAYEYLE